MFDHYEEAREYAKRTSRIELGYVGIVMEKDGRYNVAKDYDEVDYAQKLGWNIVED